MGIGVLMEGGGGGSALSYGASFPGVYRHSGLFYHDMGMNQGGGGENIGTKEGVEERTYKSTSWMHICFRNVR